MRAVVLRINSPGGTVTASDILYHEVMRFKERRKVPVVASILDVGASGGYYVALAADRILAHPTTVTGSIGVLMLTVNAERAPREDRRQRELREVRRVQGHGKPVPRASGPRSARSSRT